MTIFISCLVTIGLANATSKLVPLPEPYPAFGDQASPKGERFDFGGNMMVCKSCLKEKNDYCFKFANFRKTTRKKSCNSCEYNKRKNLPNYIAMKRRNTRSYEIKNKAVKSAHGAVRHAQISGKLVKSPCEVCGKLPANAHHDDYSQPLNIRWLCRAHHREWHALNGEGANKYPEAEAFIQANTEGKA